MLNKKDDKTRTEQLWDFFGGSDNDNAVVSEDARDWESLRSAKRSLRESAAPPDRYWMSFMPRLRHRMDDRVLLVHRWTARARLAASVSALVVLMALLSHEIFVTSPRIDYLVEQAEWLRNLNPTDETTLSGTTIERSLLDALDEQIFQGSISVEDVNLSIGFSELGYDVTSLSTEEQARILLTLEQNPAF